MSPTLHDVIAGITLGMCKKEYCIQRYLASQLRAQHHVVISGVEVDVAGDGWACEVKFNAKFYDGIGQALVYKRILGFREVWLIHVVNSDPSDHLNHLPNLLRGLNISAAVIHRGGVTFIDE
ncbi:MAG: hypothetical protein RXQ96_08320 [Thermocladium sp.]